MSRTAREVEELISGVEVELDDGTLVTGDMMLGCDGVHNVIRTIMCDHASKTTDGLIIAKENSCEFLPFKSYFQSLSLALRDIDQAIKTYWQSLMGVGAAAPGSDERDMTVIQNIQYSYPFLALT